MTAFQLPTDEVDYMGLALAADGPGLTAWWATQFTVRTAARWPRLGGRATWRLTDRTLDLSADGEWVSTYDHAAGEVRVTRVGARKPVAVLPFQHDGSFLWSAVAPGGGEVAWASGGYLFAHRLPGGEPVLKARTGFVYDLHYDRSGKWLFVKADRRVLVFDRAGGPKPVRLTSRRHPRAAVGGGTAVATGPDDRSFTVWNLATGKERAVLPAADRWACVAAVSPDGQRVLTSNTDGGVTLWDAAGGRRTEYAWGLTAIALAFAPDGLTAAAGGSNGRVVVWDLDD